MAGVLTRTQLENEALDNVAKSGVLALQSGTTLSTRMTTWVNRSQLWIARKADLLQYTATASTVASQLTYALPNNFRKIFSLRLQDGQESRKIKCIMPWEFDRNVPQPTNQTTQRSWFYVPYKDTQTFELFPIPDAAYTLKLRYSLYPSDFTAANAVSQYTNCDDAIIAYATMFAFRWLQELKDAASWEKFGNDIIEQVIETNDESEQYPDWAPSGEGFTINDQYYTGDYYNNPFIRDNNLSTWWR